MIPKLNQVRKNNKLVDGKMENFPTQWAKCPDLSR